MKPYIASLLVLATGVSVLAQQDIRVIGAATVDLAPVHEWFASAPKGRGERPMKHWRQLTLSEVKKQIRSKDVCVVVAEDGSTMTVLLANLPSEIRTPIMAFDQAETNRDRLEQQILANQKAVDGMGRTPVLAANLRKQIMDDKAQLDKVRRDLGGPKHPGPLRIAHNRALRIGFFAMATGESYGSLPVWDTGIKGGAAAQ